ncbi:hypothetical protein X271_00128 [Candidatus Hepatoplasma crinochetorum Av]|uniref:Uncharacterized protein n=1 Tax=Candidatus Hepatoplasma crinochetorum Av TaxID=1427984 RepID=W8GJ14_9MOLU|nr:hypothetical protein X271_00128 [Candidatus Hepatoplasma crinochetorum Av]
MLVIESMVLSKLINLNLNFKILINFTILALLSIIISFICFFWYPFVLYSFLYSILLVYFLFLITFIINKFLFKKISISKSLILFVVRITFFLLFFFIAIYLINFAILNVKGVELLMKPINIFIYLLVYSLYYLAVFLIPIYDYVIFFFLKRKNNKNIIKDQKSLVQNESI